MNRPSWTRWSGPLVHIDLRTLFPDLQLGARRLGRIDAISGGAITNSLLHTLLWLPEMTADVRVIEREPADLTNLNRYTQLRASDNNRLKTNVLAEGSTNEITISGIDSLFTAETRESILPLAETVTSASTTSRPAGGCNRNGQRTSISGRPTTSPPC